MTYHHKIAVSIIWRNIITAGNKKPKMTPINIPKQDPSANEVNGVKIKKEIQGNTSHDKTQYQVGPASCDMRMA